MPRQYKSAIRASQARQTKIAILEAALALFLERGYAQTSIREIAARAGVAERTIYASFGEKTGLLLGIADYAFYGGTDEEDGEARFVEEMKTIPTSHERLRRAIHQTVRGWDQGLAAIGRMVNAAATSDAQLAEFAAEMVERRHRATKAYAELIIGRSLREDAKHEQLIDELEAITSEEVYWILSVERNWDADRYEEFVFDAFIHVLARYGIGLDGSDTPNDSG